MADDLKQVVKELEARGWKVLESLNSDTKYGRLHALEINPRGNADVLMKAIKEIAKIDHVQRSTVGSNSTFYWYAPNTRTPSEYRTKRERGLR